MILPKSLDRPENKEFFDSSFSQKLSIVINFLVANQQE